MIRPILAFLAAFACGAAWALPVEGWVSSEDRSNNLRPIEGLAFTGAGPDTGAIIEITPETTHQSILGLGSSLEHATCYNLFRLDEDARNEVIRKVVHPEDGIGMNLMRVCIGTSDFVGEAWYSYSEPPEGEKDLDLEHFSIEKDREYVLPVLKKALEINPDLKFFASPWSPPAWMKTNGSMLAGKLKREYYGVYARYLAKFIEAYEAEGIPIYAITPQNEPGYANLNYPTCLWSPEEQRDFIRDYLGPTFKERGIDALIWCWDHNWDRPEFPRTVLSDPEAAKYVDGTGYHLYLGEVEAQTETKEEFPDKHIYFTEGSTFDTPGALIIIDILRNWSRSYNAWVTMLDEHQKPNNGPHFALPTAVELKDDLSVEYRYDYYMYGQFMKFIERGAVRVKSSKGDDEFKNVVFRNPDGAYVAVVAGLHAEPKTFTIVWEGRSLEVTMPPRSTATFRWRPAA